MQSTRLLKTMACAAVAMALGLPRFAFSQVPDDLDYRPWVEFHNGEISVAFHHIPIEVAAHAIRARTGFEIVVPPGRETRLVNVKLSRARLEPAVRTLITSAGFQSFAFMYDDKGRPNRAVVLSPLAARNDADEGEKPKAESRRPLSDEEREQMRHELGRWVELNDEERGRIADRIRKLPPGPEREELVKEYGRQRLGLTD